MKRLKKAAKYTILNTRKNECIVLQAKDGILKLISNNMDLGIETVTNAEIKELQV